MGLVPKLLDAPTTDPAWGQDPCIMGSLCQFAFYCESYEPTCVLIVGISPNP